MALRQFILKTKKRVLTMDKNLDDEIMYKGMTLYEVTDAPAVLEGTFIVEHVGVTFDPDRKPESARFYVPREDLRHADDPPDPPPAPAPVGPTFNIPGG